MGGLSFFEESVGVWGKPDKLTLEVVECNSAPEIRLGPEGDAHRGHMVTFKDWEQFTRFVDAVNSLHSRLEGLHR